MAKRIIPDNNLNRSLCCSGAWTLKSYPDDYLSRYPTGPNSKLAKVVLNERRARFRKSLEIAADLVHQALEVLFRNFGESLHDEDDDRNLHQFLESVLLDCLFPLERHAGYGAWGDVFRQKTIIRRQVTQKYGIKLEGHGELGKPRSAKKPPEYWRLKQTPQQYLWAWGRKKKGQNYHLARAALAPIEKAMWKELRIVDRELRQVLAPSEREIAERIYEILLDKAHLIIVYTRYDRAQSVEFFNESHEWLESRSLMIPDPDLEAGGEAGGAE